LKPLRLTAVLTSVLLASACGSTALRSGAPAATDQTLSGGTPTSEPAAPADPAGGLPVALPSDAAPSAPAPASGASSANAPRVVPNVPRVQVPVVAVKRVPVVAPKAPIRLGIIGVDAGAIAGQFGKKAPDPFDGIKPMISYFNAHEGIAGHALKPVYVRLDSKTDTEQAGQLACTALTQDNKVDLVLSLGFASETLYGCLKKEGVSIFSPGTWAADDQWLAQYPNVFLPVAMRADRYMPQMIASGVQRGTLKSGDKLGVLVEGCPWAERVYNNVIVPTAQKYGITTEKAAVTCITNIAADLATVTQDLTRDALQLATKGVTHVMALTAAEGFFDAFFSQVAGSQNYQPKYLVSSNANVFNTTDPKGTVHFSPDAVKNIIGIGWQPFMDLGSKARPAGTAQSAQQAACRQTDPTMGGALSDTTDGRYFKMGMFYATCDTLMAIKTVLLSNGNKFGIADMAVGFQTLLAKGVSAFAAGGRYGGGAFRHDGLSVAQPLAYSTTTGRPAYTGSVFAVT
jgi:hypothetical protein